MAATPLLGLSLPADGTTNWGTLVNTSITSLLDSAIAGTTTLSSDADVTLTTTTEATNQARQAVLLCTGSRAALRTITAPAQSKTYVIINATTGGFGVKIVGVGPTTGITVPSGKVFMVAWNGSDFVTIGVTTLNLASDVTGTLGVGNGGTGQTTYTDGQLLIGNTTGNTLTKATLTAGSGVTITNGSGSINISATGSGGTVTGVTGTSPVVSSGGTAPAISLASGYGDTQNPYASKTANFVLAAPNGSAGAPTFRAIVASDIPTLNQNTNGTAGGLSATLVVGSGGTGQTTYINGELLIGNSTGNTLTKATLTAGTGISVSNGTGSITIANTAPDQTVALTGTGGTTVTGTYPNFTINSTNVTYTTATSTVPGLIELGSDTVQTTAANAVSSDASRTYALQLNASGQAVVNVPWTGGSGGSVTGVTATSPVASSGGTAPVISLNAGYGDTLNPYASKTASHFLAAPNGVAGVPSFRAIAASDIPVLNQNTSGTALNLSGVQTANTVYAAPNGATGLASFRALVAADIPTLNQNTSGTAGSIAGGTAGQIPYQTGVGTTGFLGTGSTGQLLQSMGTSTPIWRTQGSSNTPNAIVTRDGYGDFAANIITATLSGNASTATVATNATNAYIALDTSSATAQYLTFAAGLIGNYGLRGASTDLTYTPSTKTLNVAGTVTTTTQTSTDNSTKVATTAFVQNVVGSAVTAGTNYTTLGQLITATTNTSYDLTSGSATQRALKSAVSGTVRVKFGLAIDIAATPALARVYVNGVAQGSEFSSSTIFPSVTDCTLDISVAPGDRIQIAVRLTAINGQQGIVNYPAFGSSVAGKVLSTGSFEAVYY